MVVRSVRLGNRRLMGSTLGVMGKMVGGRLARLLEELRHDGKGVR